MDICFMVNWDLLAAYCHFIFQFIKNDVLISRPLGLFLQPRSPVGNQRQELTHTVMGGEGEVGPVPDLKAHSSPTPTPTLRGCCACIAHISRRLNHNVVIGERKEEGDAGVWLSDSRGDRWTKIEPAEVSGGDSLSQSVRL